MPVKIPDKEKGDYPQQKLQSPDAPVAPAGYGPEPIRTVPVRKDPEDEKNAIFSQPSDAQKAEARNANNDRVNKAVRRAFSEILDVINRNPEAKEVLNINEGT